MILGSSSASPAPAAEIFDVRDFAREVIERSKQIPVLVDFWAPWCGPCKALGPALEAAVRKFAGRVVLAKVNTDEHGEWAQRAGVRGIPNVKLIIGGTLVDEFTGAQPQSVVEQWLARALPQPAGDLLADVDALLAEGRSADAQALLMQAAADPHAPPGVWLRLARLSLLDQPEAARKLLARIPADAAEADAAAAMGRVLDFVGAPVKADELPESPARTPYLDAAEHLARRDVEGAMQRLIDAVRADRKFADDAARKRLIDLFDWLGSQDERTREYRLRLYDAL
ncbi:MAG: tetratricopeptide repeat protein [Pseudomonadota bacterium]